jgi:acyl-coenzyme A thioesterase PaaI-like protein
LIYYSRPETSTSSLNAINILFALGSALNGHPQILHGGITAVLMDESMGMLLQCQSSAGTFTKTLTVEYVAPVRTPGIVLVRVEVVERRGRGVKLVARLLQKEDGEETEGGMVECARGEGLFVTPRGVKL